MINKFRFFAQAVLPLVYDDSLSYYEVLAKVVYKLNETIETVNNISGDYISEYIASGGADAALEERIDALADDLAEKVNANNAALADTLLTYDHFYKVTDLEGVTNDGTTDCYVGLRQLMDRLWTEGEHAIVYFPAGTYLNETGTLPIPANTIIMGDGDKTILYRSNVPAPTTDTSFLCPCGDNIAIYNLKVRLNVEDIPIQTGGLAVGVGVTNIEYPGIYPAFNVVRAPVRKNITVDHLYSDGVYPLQAEIAAGTGRLENIVFKNGNYPNGIVSMYPWNGADGETSPGNIGSRIENITCKWLRIGGKVSLSPNRCMYAEGLVVNNCQAEMAWLQSDGVFVNGLYINGKNAIMLGNEDVTYGIEICGEVALNNAYLIGGGNNRTYGILNRSLTQTMFGSVVIKNFTSPYLAQPWATADAAGTAMLCNCDFGNANAGIVGYGVNTKATVPSTYRYFDFTKARYATLSPGSGVTFDAPTRTRINTFGTIAWIQMSCSSTNAWLPTNVITTLPAMFAPSEDNTLGLMVGADQDGNPINKAVAIGSNGEVKAWATDAAVTSWSGIIMAIFPLI